MQKKNSPSEETINAQINDLLPGQRKKLAKQFLKFPSGQEAFVKLKSEAPIKNHPSIWRILFFIFAAFWFMAPPIMYSYYQESPEQYSNEISMIQLWIKDLISFLFGGQFSGIIIFALLIILTELVFINVLYKNKGAELKVIQNTKSLKDKISIIISLKVASIFFGVGLTVLFLFFLIFLLLPIGVLMPFMILIEEWIRANFTQLFEIAGGLVIFIYLNYLLVSRLIKEKIK